MEGAKENVCEVSGKTLGSKSEYKGDDFVCIVGCYFGGNFPDFSQRSLCFYNLTKARTADT